MAASKIKNRKAPFRRGRRWAKPMDQTTAAQAVKQPGIDPRQWVSYGLVTAGGEQEDIVVFDEDEGQALVRVLLEPTKIPVYARVAASATGAAGNGEGEWNPFVEGDEVVLLIPEGNERAGCVIIGRLNNSIDAFPMESVAGQDPTTNTFAFRRRRTPMVEEVNGPILLRSAMSEGLISMDTAGVFTVRTGDRSVLQMSPDVIGIQGPSDDSNPPEFLMQLNITDRQYSLQVGDGILNLSDSGATPEPNNLLKVADTFTLGTSGNFSGEHVMTIENFVNLMAFLMPIINPLVFATPPAADAALAGALTSCAASAGYLAAPLSKTALVGALQSQLPKTPGTTQTIFPGICSTGFMVG